MTLHHEYASRPSLLTADGSRHDLASIRAASDARLEAADPHSYRACWERWVARLLQVGGEFVEHPDEADGDLRELDAHGEVRWATRGAAWSVYCAGPHGRSHADAAELWLQGRTTDDRYLLVAIGTGYALGFDGVWRQHSWVLTEENTIVETATPMVAYAGVVRAGTEAMVFAALNIPAQCTAQVSTAGAPTSRDAAGMADGSQRGR